MKLDKELNNLGNYLIENYPSIMWAVQDVSEDIKKNFGDGVLLIGIHDNEREEFFIRNDDEHKEKWGDIIAARLIGTEKEYAAE